MVQTVPSILTPPASRRMPPVEGVVTLCFVLGFGFLFCSPGSFQSDLLCSSQPTVLHLYTSYFSWPFLFWGSRFLSMAVVWSLSALLPVDCSRWSWSLPFPVFQNFIASVILDTWFCPVLDHWVTHKYFLFSVIFEYLLLNIFSRCQSSFYLLAYTTSWFFDLPQSENVQLTIGSHLIQCAVSFCFASSFI